MNQKPHHKPEKLAQRIFDLILQNDLAQTVVVRQNVRLPGATGQHQIDVYWEFVHREKKHVVVIQAKDWQAPIDYNELALFSDVVAGLPAHARGVFVTRAPYSPGVQNSADREGILLYHVQQSAPDNEIAELTGSRLVARAHKANLIFDPAWVREDLQRSWLIEELHTTYPLNLSLPLFDENGEPVGTLAEAVNGQFSRAVQPQAVTENTLTFAAPTYLHTGLTDLPRLKLLGVRTAISVDHVDRRSRLDWNKLIDRLIEDIDGFGRVVLDENFRMVRLPIDS